MSHLYVLFTEDTMRSRRILSSFVGANASDGFMYKENISVVSSDVRSAGGR